MDDAQPYDFYTLRYVPDIVEGVGVPIGIALIGAGVDGFTGVQFARTWERVRQVDPGADLELLRAYAVELERLLYSIVQETINYRGPISRRDWLLNEIQRSFSGAIQLDPVSSVRTNSPADEMVVLAKTYLDKTRHAGAERATAGRRAIFNAMRSAFEAAAVWQLMWKDIEVAKYTRNRDPLKVDCGYTSGKLIQMFHALSLATDVTAAKGLAFSYQDFRGPMWNSEGVEPNLYAVIEDDLDWRDPAVAFALEALDRHGIDVATTAQMPAIAERAREELTL
jgi:hypothetical protein